MDTKTEEEELSQADSIKRVSVYFFIHADEAFDYSNYMYLVNRRQITLTFIANIQNHRH